ncbi:uncharacterized protein LOC111992797 [Quercus suber]|uniref:uncharacterized protein LOC111992797 n=1 Tax=Quercus suber TaxID=58331 RepID=UPI000CE1DFD2|nr:uncharacterized protein LOC111992797 [Quercus suber]
MATKLDMSKAFDRVEWAFIEKVMRKMGFNENWIMLVMKCISSVSYSVIINGTTYGNITPNRGLRQGDPLSLYLFLLCAEGFSALINEVASNNQLNGISICRGAPKVSHLFFADDSIIFCKANGNECNKLKEILGLYESASGQKINTNKSSIYFSPNTSQELKDEILRILGPMQDSSHTKYLGLPSIIGRSKKVVFAEIKDKVCRKLAGWKGKLLSLGGKEILIKAVAQAVPTYMMSCFQLPKSLYDDLEKMVRSFRWGQKHQEPKMAWVGWKTMCKLKSQGGMGFRNLKAFNLALLAKQAWRILSNLSTFVARILRANGTRWRVGNGLLIHIWEGKWLPTPSTYKVISPPCPILDYPMVSSLIDPVTRWCKIEMAHALFFPFEANVILQIPLCHNLPEDKLIWMGNKRGDFSIKSAYFVATKILDTKEEGESSFGDPNARIWKKVWSLKLQAKIKIFSWRACVNGLPVLSNMVAKGIQTSCICPICDEEPESLTHALISYDFALSVWSLWQDCPIEKLLNVKDFNDLVLHFCSPLLDKHLDFFFTIAWSIWHNRNKIIHDESGIPPVQIWDFAKNIVEEFNEASTISGVGVIVRDDSGKVIAALCKALPSHFPVEWTEFLALEQGVLLAQELNLTHVIFESDASSVILAVSQGKNGGSMGHFVQSIRSARSYFSCCLFQHVKRDYNRVAHELAQVAKCNPVSNLWKGVIPPFLVDLF